MVLYLPERLYNALKDNSQYQSIDAKFESLYESCNSIESYVKLSKDAKSLDILQILNELNGLVNTQFKDSHPEYIEEYKINNGDYLKQDMINKLYSNDKLYDTENKFYLLSNIINQSYADGQFTIYLKAYAELFESLSDKDKEPLSKYIWLKYMYSKIYTTAYNLDKVDNAKFTELCNGFTSLYSTIGSKVNDTDITWNYALEAINDSIHAVLSKSNDYKMILKGIHYFEDTLLTADFQYKQCSVSYLNLLDNKNTLYVLLNSYNNLYHNTSIICKYISDALKDLPTTLKGLGYYDKCNQNLFALQIRKYLKYLSYAPVFFSDIKINNLSPQDREYVLSNRIGIRVAASNPNIITDTHTVQDIDKWFTTKNQGLENLKNIVKGE